MELLKIKNEAGLELVVSNDDLDNYEPIIGGRSDNPTWEEYLSDYKEEARPYFVLIREALEKLQWIGRTGAQCANNTLFLFSDGLNIGFSWRAWGDIMSAIVGEREGYMAYYM